MDRKVIYLASVVYLTLTQSCSAGGKAGAITINTDPEFKLALNAILAKNLNSCQVSIDFDVEELNGFHIQTKRVCSMHLTNFQ